MKQYRGELFKRDYLPHVKAFPKTRELLERITTRTNTLCWRHQRSKMR